FVESAAPQGIPVRTRGRAPLSSTFMRRGVRSIACQPVNLFEVPVGVTKDKLQSPVRHDSCRPRRFIDQTRTSQTYCNAQLRGACTIQSSLHPDMAVHPILKMGDPRLLRVAPPVTRFDTPELHQLVADMFDTMAAANGAGLAAPQIGVDLQLVI